MPHLLKKLYSVYVFFEEALFWSIVSQMNPIQILTPFLSYSF